MTMESTMKHLQDMCDRNSADLEAYQILLSIGKDLKEPYSFRDIDKLISGRIADRSKAA